MLRRKVNETPASPSIVWNLVLVLVTVAASAFLPGVIMQALAR